MVDVGDWKKRGMWSPMSPQGPTTNSPVVSQGFRLAYCSVGCHTGICRIPWYRLVQEGRTSSSRIVKISPPFFGRSLGHRSYSLLFRWCSSSTVWNFHPAMSFCLKTSRFLGTCDSSKAAPARFPEVHCNILSWGWDEKSLGIIQIRDGDCFQSSPRQFYGDWLFF